MNKFFLVVLAVLCASTMAFKLKVSNKESGDEDLSKLLDLSPEDLEALVKSHCQDEARDVVTQVVDAAKNIACLEELASGPDRIQSADDEDDVDDVDDVDDEDDEDDEDDDEDEDDEDDDDEDDDEDDEDDDERIQTKRRIQQHRRIQNKVRRS
jgi:hypothetical protein